MWCPAAVHAADQLMVWGWRVPFLLTVFTAPLAVYMRMHMPEPFEFLEDKQQQVAQRVASTAASRVALSFTRSHAAAAPGSRTGSMRLASSFKLGSFKGAAQQQQQSSPQLGKPAAASLEEAHVDEDCVAKSPWSQSAAAAGLRQMSARQLSLQLQRSVSITSDGRMVKDAAWAQQQRQLEGPAGLSALECEQEFQHEVRQAGHIQGLTDCVKFT
jgi:hypothetical protein